KVNHGRHAGEVLHQDAGWAEGDLLAGLGLGVPAGQRFDVLCGDRSVALGAEQVLQQDLQREGKPRHVEALLQCLQTEYLMPASTDLERVLGAKAVLRHVCISWRSAGLQGLRAVSQSPPRYPGPGAF